MKLIPPHALAAMALATILWTAPSAAQTTTQRDKVVKAGPPSAAERADYLMGEFVKAWSADDSTALFGMFRDDVVLYESPTRTGRDAVRQWARENMKGTGRLRVTPFRSGGNADTLYQSGRWTLAVDKRTIRGVHTFVFTRGDGDWKLSSMYILSDPSEK
jgi:ketosteroid isomerase-like protein